MKPALLRTLNTFAWVCLFVAFFGEFVAGPESQDTLFWAGIIGAISAWVIRAYLKRNDDEREDA